VYRHTHKPTNNGVRRTLDLLKLFIVNRSVGNIVILKGFAGCHQQQMHYDYDTVQVKNSQTKPIGVLLSLSHDAHIVLYDKKLQLKKGQVLQLKKGQVLLFDGDLLHAGGAYQTDNLRLHIYLDSLEVKRMPNKTYIQK
jgi:hypothetical protein